MNDGHGNAACGANSVLTVSLPHLGSVFDVFCNGIKDEWVVWPIRERGWGATERLK